MATEWGTHAEMDMAMSQCIEECVKCHRVCVDTASRAMLIGGEHADAGRLILLMDCAQICQVNADFMLRKSYFHVQMCDICADICEWCAQSCDDLAADPLMKTCAQVCRRTALFCREMVGSLV
jgi:hypothetical protein